MIGNNDTHKLALVIGINYFNDKDNELFGCINDAHNIKQFLVSNCNFKNQDIIVMTDDLPHDSHLYPNKENIQQQIINMEIKANQNNINELWFSYSGHGYFKNDLNNDEIDGQDEVICPVDGITNGDISDDWIFNNLVKKLPYTSSMVFLMDCCHSGSIIDLPYLYKNSIIKSNNNEVEAQVLKISGCNDSQTSADAYIKDYTGAMTYSFLHTLENSNYNITTRGLIKQMRSFLVDNKYEQIPVLSFSRIDDLDHYFIKNRNTNYNQNANIRIMLRTDKYGIEDSTNWSLLDLSNHNYIYQNKPFTKNNEINELILYLAPGNYKFIGNDIYGDGGIMGEICYINGEHITNIVFKEDSNYELPFSVTDKDLIPFNPSNNVQIVLKTDEYGISESMWNIYSYNIGQLLYENFNKFSKTNELQKTTIILEKGIYILVLIDSYGDGGIEGYLELNNNLIKVINFKDGYKQYNKFIIY